MITYRKIGGLHFIKLGTRFQLSFCRLSAKRALNDAKRRASLTHDAIDYVRTNDDQWFDARDIEPRHVCTLDSSDPVTGLNHYTHLLSAPASLKCIQHNAATRYTRFLQSPAMRESREVESILLGLVCVPVIMIWSLTLIIAADRLNWF